MEKIRHFYNHLHIKEINLNIIYMATDYSMYKARTASKLKLNYELAFCVNSPKKAWGDLIWQRSRDFNSAWKLSSNKEYSR